MDIKQLRYFVHVSEMGSVSKAAAALAVAQPAISRQVRKLEEELGVPLLYRNGRGVETTEAGRILLGRGRLILEDLERAASDVRAMSGVPTGQVTLGAPPTVSQVLVIPLIKRLRQHHPNVSLQVIEAFSGYVNEWLASGRLDVAVLYNAPRTKHMATEQLLEEKLFMVTGATPDKWPVSADGTVPLSALAETSLVLPSRPHGLRLLVDRIAGEAHVPLRVDFEIDALPAIKELVEDGVGATILPYASVHREVSQGRMRAIEIVDPEIKRMLIFATSAQRPLTLASRMVTRELKSVVSELIEDGTWRGAY